jgi:hypothetical protein
MTLTSEQLAKQIHKHVKQYSDPALEQTKDNFNALFKELDSLTTRLNALEEQAKGWREFGYCGPHKQGEIYQIGNFVTHQGALWHCNRKTQDQPGTSSSWTLAMKSHQK